MQTLLGMPDDEPIDLSEHYIIELITARLVHLGFEKCEDRIGFSGRYQIWSDGINVFRITVSKDGGIL